jgi:hypothetical protein
MMKTVTGRPEYPAFGAVSACRDAANSTKTSQSGASKALKSTGSCVNSVGSSTAGN